jgi:formyl-CoA transferase
VEAPDVPGGKVSQIGIPIHLSETPGLVRHVGPVTGQHTEEVLRALGYTGDQLSSLKQRKVVQ